MSKHTPGPWRTNKRSIRSTTRAIASVHCPKHLPENHPTILADAALIAAAPELLEALKLALEDLRSGSRFLANHRVIADAIAKAEGNTG